MMVTETSGATGSLSQPTLVTGSYLLNVAQFSATVSDLGYCSLLNIAHLVVLTLLFLLRNAFKERLVKQCAERIKQQRKENFQRSREGTPHLSRRFYSNLNSIFEFNTLLLIFTFYRLRILGKELIFKGSLFSYPLLISSIGIPWRDLSSDTHTGNSEVLFASKISKYYASLSLPSFSSPSLSPPILSQFPVIILILDRSLILD